MEWEAINEKAELDKEKKTYYKRRDQRKEESISQMKKN